MDIRKCIILILALANATAFATPPATAAQKANFLACYNPSCGPGTQGGMGCVFIAQGCLNTACPQYKNCAP